MNLRAYFLFPCLLLTACAEDQLVYAGMEFEVQSSPPSPVSFEADRIELMAGLAVKVEMIPHSSGELEYSDQDLLTVRSSDPGLLEVYNTENEREFVLVGADPGQTCLEVTINRQRQECIEVRILPPITE